MHDIECHCVSPGQDGNQEGDVAQGEAEAGDHHQDEEEPEPQPALGHPGQGLGGGHQAVHQAHLAVRDLNTCSVF